MLLIHSDFVGLTFDIVFISWSLTWLKLRFGPLLLFHRNGKGKGKLSSCAIRPAAIYGPGEERHLPRIVKLAKLGLLPFKIGEMNVKSDWVYVDNIVLALLLASMGLLDDIPGREGPPVAAGQAYFISDGKVGPHADMASLYFVKS